VTRHPSVINMCPQSEQKPEHGPSLVHWAVENTSSNKLLELLLSASCGVGLLPDGNGRTAIHAAIEHSKLFHMRLLSTAIVEGRFTMLPGPMRAVTATFPIWAAKFPADFLAIVSSMQMQAEPEILGGLDTQGVMLPRMLIHGSNWRCPKQTLWAEDLERYRPLDDDDLPFWPMMMGQPGGPSSVVSGASTVNEGFSKVNLGGVQAWRVPFECFAGIVGDEDEEGAAEDDQQAVSVLQLLLRAVAETKDYACFDSMPLEVMLQYKWVAFGRRIYIRQCLGAVLDFVLTVVYNMTQTSNRWGERWIDTLDESGQASSSERTIAIISVCGFCWTTLVALRRGGSAVSSMKQRYMRRETVFETDRVLMLVASASSIITNGFVLYARTNPDAVADSATVVIGAAESDSADGWLTFEAMQFMHALTILAFTLRLCFFSLRGFLRFGALIHMVFVVVIDIMPFMVLLGFMILGFSLALSLVTTDREGSLLSTHGFLSALSTTVDMGLYAASIQPQVMHEPSVFVLYFPFMLLVQVVLLNLLIAIMTASHNRVGSRSALFARYQRAQLIVDLEQIATAQRASADEMGDRIPVHVTLRSAWTRLCHLLEDVFTVFEYGARKDDPRPRWLHVLTPPDEDLFTSTSELSTVEKSVLSLERRLNGFRTDVTASLKTLTAGQQRLLADSGGGQPVMDE